MVTTNQAARAQRSNFSNDHHRPVYHFLPPSNWMNDPNGVIQWGDKFHLFYQYNPESARFGLKHWGHAISEDLIHWRDLPIALVPTSGGADERGCWSGCTVNNDGVPTILYTGVRGERHEIQTQCLATSQDRLLTWEKYTGNPILSEIPAVSQQNYDFRDPFVWREGETWYMLLASRIKDVGGTVFLYRSSDLVDWEYLSPLLTGSIDKHGSVWECANFFPLGDKWVLIVAGKGGNIPYTVFYFVGDYVNQQFTPETEGILDYAYFYAPLTMQDAQNRRLLFGWLREGRSVEACVAAGWAGTHSIPRELRLQNGLLHMEPVPALNSIRGGVVNFTNIPLSDKDYILDIQGLALDITADFEVSGTAGLVVACAPDGSEQTRISYDSHSKRLIVNREQSSLNPGNDIFSNEAPHELAPGEPLQLRILLDGSILEVIANARTSLSCRIYPSRADSQGMRIFGQGVLKTMSLWQLSSIWTR